MFYVIFNKLYIVFDITDNSPSMEPAIFSIILDISVELHFTDNIRDSKKCPTKKLEWAEIKSSLLMKNLIHNPDIHNTKKIHKKILPLD